MFFCLVFVMSLCASVYLCLVVTCWERTGLLALVCGAYCEFVTFPLVSWVRCGTRLYRFLLFAPLLTLQISLVLKTNQLSIQILSLYKKQRLESKAVNLVVQNH